MHSTESPISYSAKNGHYLNIYIGLHLNGILVEMIGNFKFVKVSNLKIVALV
jgi:hypothetical protein